MKGHPGRAPDVLRDGVCGRGLHRIASVEQTIRYPGTPGRFCLACASELAEEMGDEPVPQEDPDFIDELAIDIAVEGLRGDRVPLRQGELDIAVDRLLRRGFTWTEAARRLRVSEPTLRRAARRNRERQGATA